MDETELQLIVSKFKSYKENGDSQNYFGRDVSFKSAGISQVGWFDACPFE